jgi:hypothetical protein
MALVSRPDSETFGAVSAGSRSVTRIESISALRKFADPKIFPAVSGKCLRLEAPIV